IQRIIRALNIILEKSADLNLKTMILLEDTAGSGTHLGYTFYQLKRMIEGAKDRKRIGTCFDTCHAFAAGYDLSHQEGIEQTLEEFEKYIGLDKLKVIHLNDSKYPLGSRKDRHMHIGKGYIGLEGFKVMVNHKYLKDLPFILETPKNDEKDDQKNGKIRKLLLSAKLLKKGKFYMDKRNELIKEWIHKADHDIGMAKLAIEHKAEYTDLICFHCQQAVEKYLKAYLVHLNIVFRKTHSLSYLLDLINEMDKISDQMYSMVEV
ncbi:unnamed protein product, partial [marine sediment metagenome]